MTERLKAKHIVVTGAATGIGQGIAIELARQGAHVAVLHHEHSPDATLSKIEAEGGSAFAIEADVSNEEAVMRAFTQMDERFGTIDGLVNNAAVFARTPFSEVTGDEWDRLFHVNVKGYFLMAREAARRMMRQRSGKIVNISSTAALSAVPNYSTYCATKAAIVGYTLCMGTELAPHGIQANCLVVGHTQTVTHDASEEFVMNDLHQRIPAGRRATCQDIARAAVFLLSPDSDYITAESIRVDGGLLAYQGPTGYTAENRLWKDAGPSRP